MRPRGIPRGKRPRGARVEEAAQAASMRPRGIPRGKRRSARLHWTPTARFNEAAGNTPRKTVELVVVVGVQLDASMRPRGIPRGKLRGEGVVGGGGGASMRPRGIPRGKHDRARWLPHVVVSASMRPRGIPRGKRRRSALLASRTKRFNEAAGNTPRKTSWSTEPRIGSP